MSKSRIIVWHDYFLRMDQGPTGQALVDTSKPSGYMGEGVL